ncbi:MAG: response regulator transcription factor [Candidatus Omnitrophica bacterium]|nr:response regulator transcription factor [Candidatus Omnitrophota bacterium]
MAKASILIVEDDTHISKLVKYNLEKAGFACTVSPSGEEALDILGHQTFDLILLDIMLPELDGFEVCKKIKQDPVTSSIPVLMLTARGEEIDRVIGLELGAEDYVVKPFSMRELTLRIKAVLRRRTQSIKETKDVLVADKLTLDISRHKVLVNQKEVTVTAMEFKLLKVLLERRGRVQSRDRLLEDVWDIASDITTRTVDTHIKRLRQKLGKPGKMIETVRGIGYRFSE